MNTHSQNRRNLSLVRNYLIGITILISIVQLYFNNTTENIICNLLAISTFIPVCWLIFHSRNRGEGDALIATIIFLIVVSNTLMPMIGTILEGHSLTFTLRQPVLIFFHRGVFALILLLAHFMAKTNASLFLRHSTNRLGSIMSVRSFVPPKGIWILGLIGFSSYLLRYFSLPSSISKLLAGFGFLSWSPFLFFLPPYSNYLREKLLKWKLLLYYIFQVGISLVNNSRMGIIGPVAVVAAGWIVLLLLGHIVVYRKIIKNSIKLGLIGIVLFGQFKDLSTAILIERAHRSTRSPTEQMEATFERFLDKESLYKYELYLNSKSKSEQFDISWDENYVHNPVLGRFIQIKFDDNSFFRVLHSSSYALADLKEVSINKMIALIPEPILQLLGIDINKKEINSYSIGDIIETLSGNVLPKSFLTGSILAHSYALFGIYYPLVLILLYFLIFSVLQGLFSTYSNLDLYKKNVSTFVLLMSFKFFNDLALDGVTAITGFLLRDIWQNIIIYFIALQVLSFLRVRTKNLPINSSLKKSLLHFEKK